jgi:hypothetical protein
VQLSAAVAFVVYAVLLAFFAIVFAAILIFVSKVLNPGASIVAFNQLF